MSYTDYMTTNIDAPLVTNGFIKRISVFSFGLLAYTIGCAGLFWLILGLGGLAPVSLSSFQTESLFLSIAINLGLITLFGLQHSVMARSHFKEWIVQFIPQAAERATYMLMSGVATIIAIYFWQPVPGTVWSVESGITQVALWSVYAIGWAYLLLSTFITNHFELMGLRQVYLYFRNIPYTRLPFTRKYMYRYSRHPMMLGVLLGMWAVPVMSTSHFIMATLLTVYMTIGVFLEERDLVKNFGETYRSYKKEIATFIPRIF